MTPIPPSEFLAWFNAMGVVVRPDEYAILRAMDVEFCSCMQDRVNNERIRKADEAKREQEVASKGKGRFSFFRKR
ncbi:MAG TPA: hypothetical protein PK205_07260 [Promineifilum sp.]|nr:hypothetical protein [Promineifilum sp.]